MSQRPTAAIILAAGKSTRMKSDLPKVMHEVCGRPMLAYVLDACAAAGLQRIIVVVGHQKQIVLEAFGGRRDLTYVEQTEQRGTGHAVLMARDALRDFQGDVFVIAGDMPMIRAGTLRELRETHVQAQAAASIATTVLEEPFGYGRIVRDTRGEFLAIVEERDCTDAQRQIKEVNPSYYLFDRAALFDALQSVRPDNAKKEYYLTDVLRILREQGRRVVAQTSVPPADATGINSRADLAEVSRLMQARLQGAIMDSGVTIIAPALTWIEAGASIGPEAVIHPYTWIGSGAQIGARCRIGPFAVVARDARIGDDGIVCGHAAEPISAAPERLVAETRRVPVGQAHGTV